MTINPYQKYQKSQVETSSPQRLLLMLYDGAIRFLRFARLGLEESNIDKSHTYICKTQDIITELMSCLDLGKGEVARHLLSLYDYMYSRLLEANLKKDAEILLEVEGMLTELRQAWSEAMAAGAGSKAAAI